MRRCQGAGAERAVGCKSLTAASRSGEGRRRFHSRHMACEVLGEKLTGRANNVHNVDFMLHFCESGINE